MAFEAQSYEASAGTKPMEEDESLLNELRERRETMTGQFLHHSNQAQMYGAMRDSMAQAVEVLEGRIAERREQAKVAAAERPLMRNPHH